MPDIVGEENTRNRAQFKKSDRILKRPDFIRLKAESIKAHSPYFMAVFAQRNQENTRLGITTTKRVGNAVTRNRIKRCVREYYRTHKSLLPGGWDVHIIAKSQAAKANSLEMRQSLHVLFNAIKRKILQSTHGQNVYSMHQHV